MAPVAPRSGDAIFANVERVVTLPNFALHLLPELNMEKKKHALDSAQYQFLLFISYSYASIFSHIFNSLYSNFFLLFLVFWVIENTKVCYFPTFYMLKYRALCEREL